MDKKKFFFILTIVFIMVSTGFAQDNNPTHIPILSDESFSISFYPMNNPNGILMVENMHSTAEDDELDKALLEDFDDSPGSESVFDPLYYFNYLMYSVNDFLYFQAIKPVATGYKAIMPDDVRKGIGNFFHNIVFPVRFVNNILQGELKDAGTEIQIFLINSTIGGLGFAQVAQNKFNLHTANEDLGQTLGSYSIGNGFYLVLPLFGPSTFRDLIGRVGDYFLTPVNYVEPWGYSAGIKAVDTINSTSFHIGDYEALKKAALDPYIAIRNAYIQNRREKIKK